MNLKSSDGFFDLCINVENEDTNKLFDVLTKVYEMGYGTVAINQTITDDFPTDKNKKKKRQGSAAAGAFIPDPIDTGDLKEKFKGKLQIFNRLTFVCADQSKTHPLAHSAKLKQYDIYAIIPKSQNIFQFACSQLNVDIITVNASCSNLKMTRKLYLQAVERGIHFEIHYSEFLNLNTRKTAIHYSHMLYVYGKSKNVIVSSGTNNPQLIRNPYDIINLLALAGLNEIKSKGAIHWKSRNVLLGAERRRYGKAIFTIELATDRNTDDENDVPLKKIHI